VSGVKVTGLREAQEGLIRLEARTRKSLLRKAVRVGGKELLTAARATAPVDSGWLRAQLRVSVKVDTRIGTATATIKAKRSKAQRRKGMKTRHQVIHLVTLGTRPHVIPGPVAFAGGVYHSIDHPGAAANPFMDRALERSGRAALAAFTKSLGRLVESEARNIGAKT
jgi:hypothetical protein